MSPAACDGLGASPLRLASALTQPRRGALNWIEAAGRDVVYTHQGRNAIALFCRMAALRPGDEVLAPAYNCGAEIDPFVKAGARVVLYDVHRSLGIDVGRIIASLTRATRILYVTHFFGFPQPLGELAAACGKQGVLLMEDCAQALYSASGDKPAGLAGDAAVFSFVKTLPVPDGGALLADRRFGPPRQPEKQPPAAATGRACLPLVKRWLVNSASSSPLHRLAGSVALRHSRASTAASDGRRRPPMLSSNRYVEARTAWTMSRVARGILAAADGAEVARARRRNFQFLLEALRSVPGFEPALPALPEGVSPMAFPFFGSSRSYWYSQLTAKGILVQGWPGYYPGLDWDACPGACFLKDELLTLPVHQGLTEAHMQYIADAVRAAAKLAPAGSAC